MNNQIKLISGTFSAEEANEVLLNIFKNKIQFHEMKNFSSIERLGIPHDESVKRIPELKKGYMELNELIKLAQLNNKKIDIQSVVSATLI